MSNEPIASNHSEAPPLSLDDHELVRRLNSHLGTTIVATLAGVHDSKLPYRWAKPDGPKPNEEELLRLQVAHKIWIMVSDAESTDVARSWFVGNNPLLGEVAPFVALREGDVETVLLAAQAFIEDTWIA